MNYEQIKAEVSMSLISAEIEQLLRRYKKIPEDADVTIMEFGERFSSGEDTIPITLTIRKQKEVDITWHNGKNR